MFLYGDVFAFVGLDGWMCMHMYVEARVEIQAYVLRCCSSLALRQGLFLTWSFPSGLGWVTSKFGRPVCFCFPGDRTTSACHYTQFFICVLRIKFRPSCLCGKHLPAELPPLFLLYLLNSIT